MYIIVIKLYMHTTNKLVQSYWSSVCFSARFLTESVLSHVSEESVITSAQFSLRCQGEGKKASISYMDFVILKMSKIYE